MSYMPINISSTGNNTVIANSTGNIITVFALFFQCSVASTVTIKSGTNLLTGPMSFVAGGGLEIFWGENASVFTTNTGEDFIFNVTGILPTVSGQALYVIYPA